MIYIYIYIYIYVYVWGTTIHNKSTKPRNDAEICNEQILSGGLMGVRARGAFRTR